MKTFICVSLYFTAAVAAIAAPFTPLGSDEAYGVPSIAWRFNSSLSKKATGRIEICYAEVGSAERVLGTVDVRPFHSSSEKMPDLRILFTNAELDGKKLVVLLVGYGIRSGVFVVDVPGLTSHSLAGDGAPHASPSGEYTLMGFGDGAVTFKPDGTRNMRGRLFFHYIGKET